MISQECWQVFGGASRITDSSWSKERTWNDLIKSGRMGGWDHVKGEMYGKWGQNNKTSRIVYFLSNIDIVRFISERLYNIFSKQ